jgi:hypothetical protein
MPDVHGTSRIFYCDCTQQCSGIKKVVSEITYKRHRPNRLGLGPDQFSAEFTRFLANTAREFLQPPGPSSQLGEPESQKRVGHGQETESQRTRDKRRRIEQPENTQVEQHGDETQVWFKFRFLFHLLMRLVWNSELCR